MGIVQRANQTASEIRITELCAFKKKLAENSLFVIGENSTLKEQYGVFFKALEQIIRNEAKYLSEIE